MKPGLFSGGGKSSDMNKDTSWLSSQGSLFSWFMKKYNWESGMSSSIFFNQPGAQLITTQGRNRVMWVGEKQLPTLSRIG